MAKQKPLSEGSLKALEILKEQGSMTLAEMKEKGFDTVNSSHLTALKNRGLISTESVEKEVTTIAKRTVNVYTAIVTEKEESAE